MALNGAVYNVTQYMDFHPSGWEELVKGVGRDATDMYMKALKDRGFPIPHSHPH